MRRVVERSHPGSGPAAGRSLSGLLHLHRFRWVSDDAFSGSGLYACRCGQVRPGL